MIEVMIDTPLRRMATVLTALVLAGSSAACSETVAGQGHYADAKNAAASATDTPTPEKPLKIDQLPALMLSADDVGTIIGVPGTQSVMSYQAFEQLPDNVISEPKCFGAMFGAVEPVYRASGYEGVYGQRLANPTNMIAGRSDEGVIAFGTAAEAKAFVDKQTDAWKGCGGRSLALTVSGMQVNWMVDTPRISHGVDVLTRTQEGGDGFGCGRGLFAKSNTVIDVVVCGPDPAAAGDQAAAITDRIIDRYPK
jgi:serine/threonine kinase PknH